MSRRQHIVHGIRIRGFDPAMIQGRTVTDCFIVKETSSLCIDFDDHLRVTFRVPHTMMQVSAETLTDTPPQEG